jgi:Peptidase family M23
MSWWQDVYTQFFNPPVETGQDIGTPFHTQITALLPGRVISTTTGGYGGRVDVATAAGDVYYQHLDTFAPGLRPGSTILAGQTIGLSGGQLSGGNLPNSPLNSTGPHIEVGLETTHGFVNPFGLIAKGPQTALNPYDAAPGVGSAGASGAPAATAGQGAPLTGGGGSGGGLVNINFPDPIAGLRDWVDSGLNQGKAVLSGTSSGFLSSAMIPLVIAALIILVVLGTGQKTQQAPAPQVVPIPV